MKTLLVSCNVILFIILNYKRLLTKMQLYKVSIKVILMNVFVDLKQTLNVLLKVIKTQNLN